jgi:hypothetical protein
MGHNRPALPQRILEAKQVLRAATRSATGRPLTWINDPFTSPVY